MECVGSWKCAAYAFYNMQADCEHAMQLQGTNACQMPSSPSGDTMNNMQLDTFVADADICCQLRRAALTTAEHFIAMMLLLNQVLTSSIV